jgi:hypothetical protein
MGLRLNDRELSEAMSARGALVAAALLWAGCGCDAQPASFYSKSFQGQVPPELTSTRGRWLNTDGELTLESLRGRVVWLEFSFLH